MGFDSKCSFAPPYILVGLLLCPWMWGISSKLLQHHAATTPAPCSHCSNVYYLAGASLPLDMGYLLKVSPVLGNHGSSAYHLAGASLPLDLKLINTSITLHSYFIITFFFMVGTFKIQSFSNFEVYVVLSIQFSVVLMLCLYQIIRDSTFRSFNDR